MTVLIALAAAIAFTASDLLVRHWGEGLGTWPMIAVGNLVLAVAALAGAFFTKCAFLPKRWGWAGLAAALRCGAILCSILALKDLPVSQYYLIIYFFPLWAMLLGLFLGEKPRKWQLSGLLIALLGVGLVFNRGEITWGLGLLFALGCSLCLAGQIVITRKLKDETLPSLAFSNGALALATSIVWLCTHAGSPSASFAWSPAQMGALAAITLANLLAPVGQIYAAQRMTPLAYGLLSYAQIPIAVAGAWLILGEAVPPGLGYGLTLVTLGSLASIIPPKRQS